MAQPRSNSSKKTSSGGGTSRTGSAKSGTSGRSSSSKSGGSARKSYSGSRSHSTAAMKNVRLFKKQNGKWTLNWPVIIAFAILLSIYLIVTLFNGSGAGPWKEGWEDLQGNVSSTISGISGELQNSSAPTDPAPGGTPLAPTVRVHFIDVGQGDSILIENGEESFLIDAGENDNGDEVLAYLDALGIRKLDIAVGTHPHSDHIGGLDTVLRSVPAKEVWQPDLPESVIPTTRTYEDLMDAIDSCGAKDYIVGPGDAVDLCGGRFEVLGPVKAYTDLNDASLVIRFTYGDMSFLFTGDMEKTAEADLLASGANVKADVLKMGHHGSSTSTGAAFADAVDADYYVIQCGAGNDYGHPHREIKAFLEEEGAPYWRTDEDGSVVMTCDGRSVTVSTEK